MSLAFLLVFFKILRVQIKTNVFDFKQVSYRGELWAEIYKGVFIDNWNFREYNNYSSKFEQ